MKSTTPNAELMKSARASLAGKWAPAAGATFVYMLVLGGIQIIPILGAIVVLVISGAMAIGYCSYMLAVSRGESPSVSTIFSGFSKFFSALLIYILACVIVFVGLILLVVPGIYAAFALCMVWFIKADNPEIGVIDTIKESFRMMKGNKWKIFCLFLRFIGWAFLCVFTFGIGLLWLMPYVQVSFAKFYEEVRGEVPQNA